jgi:hypothetical protein
LKVDSSAQRPLRALRILELQRICQLIHPQRPQRLQRLQQIQRSSQLSLQYVAAPHAPVLRYLLGQRVSDVEHVLLPELEVHPRSSTLT